MIMIRNPPPPPPIKNIYIYIFFHFNWPKDVDENSKNEIEFIIKSNESLAENKIKNKIEKLLLKYNHGNNILEHRKQRNE